MGLRMSPATIVSSMQIAFQPVEVKVAHRAGQGPTQTGHDEQRQDRVRECQSGGERLGKERQSFD